MEEKPDSTLLREYAKDGNDDAFRELVLRHTDLIYSAALRQVASSDLARDVTQSVFTDLARKARSLATTLNQDTSILGWLYRSARFAALNQLRDERLRQIRERQAMEYLSPPPGPEAEWERVYPVLDEAMTDLSEEDRGALLLRFFKNRNFHAIGESLGISEDTAQKRVSRALEKLRAEFARRGITTTAVALSTALSAHAVNVAPAGLAAALSTTALAGTAVTSATATTALIMTTIQKTTVITAIVIAGIATPLIIHQRAAARQQRAEGALQQQEAELAKQQAELARLAQLAAATDRGIAQSNDLLRLRAQAAAIERQSNALPALRTENRRLQAAADLPEVEPLETEKQEVQAKMAESKKWVMASFLYARKNQGQFPSNLTQVASGQANATAVTSTAASDQMELVYRGSFAALKDPQTVIVLKQKQAVPYGNRWAKVYGYGDGHVEMHVQAEKTFDEWESQHITAPATPAL
jgi:RNA polymerase sigma factor (sigma-70 family)